MKRFLCLGFSLVIAATAMTAASCGGGSTGASTPISVAVSATTTTVDPGGTVQVTATVANDSDSRGVTWGVSCDAPSCGTVAPTTTPSGSPTTYTAPSTPPGSLVTVTITATSVADRTKTVATTVTIAAISVSVSPSTATVAVGAGQPFTATVTGDPSNGGVNWTVSCATAPCGTVSPTKTASGVPTTYSAPSATPVGDLGVTILASPAANAAVSGSASITVPGLTVTVSPDNVVATAGTTAQFTATVANEPSNSGVTWTVACPTAACGSVSPTTSASGVAITYTAPADIPAGDLAVNVVATSVANSAASGAASVAVPGISISIAAASTVDAGGTVQVTATVFNDTPNKGVTWSVSCSPAPCGSVSPTATASGVAATYTAPTTAPPVDLSVVITATSVTNTGAVASVTIVVPAIVVSVVPAGALLPEKLTLQLTATVAHDPTAGGVTWAPMQSAAACSPTCGSVSPTSTASGVATTYTAPAKVPANPIVEVTATSADDTTKSGAAAVTVSAGTVALVPNTLNFGRVVVNTNSTALPVTLTNSGTSVLGITSIVITGTNLADFSQTNTCSSSVGAGMPCTISFVFKPSALGLRTASASITDSSSDSPQQISLSGTGITQRPRVGLAVRSALVGNTSLSVPAPTGRDIVGTRLVTLVDASSTDPYLKNGSKRELLVRFWYPAALTQTCKAAEYTSPRVWKYFSQLLELPLPEVKTNSCWEAPMTPGVHPVVVFTPGYTATFTDYTFLFEDLASRGYVVASVNHTYEATAVEFPDGKFVQSMVGSHLSGVLQGDDKAISFAIYVRFGDLRFVVNELGRLNGQGSGPFGGKLDLARIGVAGHSMGGLSAFLLAEHEPRVKTGILLDAAVPNDLVIATQTPMLLLGAGREKWTSDDCHLWSNLHGPRLAVNLIGSEHVTPSDAVWLARNAIDTGNMSADKAIAAVRDYVAAFLDAHLRGKSEEHLSLSSMGYPDAAVTTQNQVPCGKP